MDILLSPQQRQLLSQAQIQSLEILSMDIFELNQFLKNEYLENPLLDHSENSHSIENHEPLTSYYEHFPGSGFGMHISTDEEDNRTQDFSAPREDTLQNYLLSQLDTKLYSQDDWELFIYLIGCLDDNGFFTMPVAEVAQKTNHSQKQIIQALSLLCQLEPYGIFSSNLEECLLRQLDSQDMNTPILKQIILSHLQDIADGKISTISRKLRISTAEVRKCIDKISRLNPRPLCGFGSGRNSYIIPDIIFQKEPQGWLIQLNDSWIENYHLNDYYVKMMAESSNRELIDYFQTKLNRIQFILNSIEQRRKTLLSISQTILDTQKEYFELGAPLNPMTMLDIASKSGIHTSTVSRAIKGKYLQYPGGSILIKNLFTTAVSSNKQGVVSTSLIKQHIKEYINTENKTKPYSDQVLAALLEKRGIRISRRAIAKYREELGIKGSFCRRTE